MDEARKAKADRISPRDTRTSSNRDSIVSMTIAVRQRIVECLTINSVHGVVGIQLVARAMQGPSRGELGDARGTPEGSFARFAAVENSEGSLVGWLVGSFVRSLVACIYARTLIHGWYFARRVYFKASSAL